MPPWGPQWAGAGGPLAPSSLAEGRDPPGVRFSPVEFGNMQKVNKPDVVCEDPEETVVPESCSE